ncbi:helix-turn-helix transcriptional regulator [Luedemannella flava]|uniref:helix-turn-helix transcriptional regulator n=1 Tax=Luedemannella flava TaxID=349316 RepID=UPI0031D87295
MPPTANQRRALADFLKARRARLCPADVGLPAGPVRRAPGLRREEVAVLAGVSVTWYTWLEQGRRINPSESVLRAIARTLCLRPDETAHLLELAGPAPVIEPAEPSPALQDLVDSQHAAPAFIIDRRWDLIAWNAAADAVWNYSAVPVGERNLAWLTFHPIIRARLVDWAGHARRVVAEVRAGSAALSDDRRFAEVLAELRARHPEVDDWWSAGDVRTRTGVRKVYDHPDAGRLHLDEVILRPAGAPDLQLVVLVPVRDTGTADRLAALATPAEARR